MAKPQTVALDLASLAELDEGVVTVLLSEHFRRVAQDCLDRPADSTKRKITVQFIVQPRMKPNGECDDALVTIECKNTIPTYRTNAFQMRLSKGGLLFNRDFPDSVDQTSLGFKDDE